MHLLRTTLLPQIPVTPEGGIATYLGNARISNNLIYSNSVVFGGGLLLLNGGQVINNTLIGNNAQFVGTVLRQL
jgi:hypothetical protein